MFWHFVEVVDGAVGVPDCVERDVRVTEDAPTSIRRAGRVCARNAFTNHA
jgi:hypothetical protein